MCKDVLKEQWNIGAEQGKMMKERHKQKIKNVVKKDEE